MDSLNSVLPPGLFQTMERQELESWKASQDASGKVRFELVFDGKREDKQRNVPERSSTGNQVKNNTQTSTKEGNVASSPAHLACIQDYEDHCREHLSKWNYLYVSGASMTDSTTARNKKAFRDIAIRPKHMVDISNVKLNQHILTTGEVVSCPIAIAPTSLHQWATPEGELATVRAAKTAGVIYVSSMHANTKLEDIANAEPSAIRWQQTNIFKDRKITAGLLHRAEAAGITAIVLTMDKQVEGLSWNMERGLTGIPLSTQVPNFPGSQMGLPYETAITWDDVSLFCKQTSLPVILKGILTPEDVEMAVWVGAKGVIVSNHGGRALDCLPATMDVLRMVVEASKGRVEIFMDGGVRTGLDVFKALAYGARMVFIGRAVWWGLAHSGQAGLEDIFRILKKELLNVMQLAGTPTVDDITIDRVYTQITSSL